MLGTEFFMGQGFGNQLFCYVTARCLALDLGCEFSTIGRGYFGDLRFNRQGVSFMNLDLGREAKKEDFRNIYREKTTRFFNNKSEHDRTMGCDISLYDEAVTRVSDSTLLYGILQSEEYFLRHRDRIREWLRVRPEADCREYSRDDLCVINIRGSEYVGLKELYLNRKYWLNGMKNMRKINPEMRFVIITEDVHAARRILPEVEAFHFYLAKDYTIIKNARYLLLSNSTFACFPAFTSETVRMIIAPKYWARHNVSDGYWATGQNIYSGWTDQDRNGRLFSAEECRGEFEEYRKRTGIYEKVTGPMGRPFMPAAAFALKTVLKKIIGR